MEITRIDTGKTFPGDQEVLWYTKDDVVYLEPSEEELAEMSGMTLTEYREYRADQKAQQAYNEMMTKEFGNFGTEPDALDHWKHA